MEFLSKSFPGGFIEAGPEMAGKKNLANEASRDDDVANRK